MNCPKTGCFDTMLFQYKLKQWSCTKILITASIVCTWTRKTFWVNILCSLHCKPSMHYLQLSWINLYQNHFHWKDFVSKWPVSELPHLSVAVNQNLLRLRVFSDNVSFFSQGSRFKVCFYFRWTSLWSYRGWHFVCFFSVSAAFYN